MRHLPKTLRHTLCELPTLLIRGVTTATLRPHWDYLAILDLLVCAHISCTTDGTCNTAEATSNISSGVCYLCQT